MKPLKDRISITIDSDLRQKLIELAEEEDRSLSQYINITMKRHVEKLENDKK
ncbi:MAG: toxin-antitoxin system protein [Clostridia bacterium]|nr:toxin-antitoxin system protein [Clostridia bacterium]